MTSAKESDSPSLVQQFRELLKSMWRAVMLLFVTESTLDRREVDKLTDRWEREEAEKKARENPPA